MIEMIDTKTLCEALAVGWTEKDLHELESELRPYTDRLEHYVSAGGKIPSHIEGTGSVCVPLTSITDPYQLFREAEGTVSRESFEVHDFDQYWITVHYSTVPVVILLSKTDYTPLDKLSELCGKCSDLLSAPVGGDTGAYLQFNLPGFSWTLHTDDEYEGVSSRVHVPLRTNPSNFLAWAERLDATEREWISVQVLKRGKIYRLRTDVPHTAVNRHPTDGRLHLILDIY